MPPFKDEQIIIISPGSLKTHAQLGLPESFTPAQLQIKSRMFPAEKKGEWEPLKIRTVRRPSQQQEATNGETKENGDTETKSESQNGDSVTYEEDPASDEGAVWPIKEGRVVNWSCFFALMSYVHNCLSPPFHTPILLISEPCWTSQDHEKLTQFFFEKFKMPAFAIMDAALATCYAYGIQNATIVDVGFEKADITAVSDFVVHHIGRLMGMRGCGGEALTQRLLKLLGPKGFSREMCEQLKRSNICEVLPQGTDLPSSDTGNNAAAASSAVTDGPDSRKTSIISNQDMGELGQKGEENGGVLDVAKLVASGNMEEYLAKKERDKTERAASKKKGFETKEAAPKPVKLPNSKKERNTFMYEDHALLGALKDMNLNSVKMAKAHAALDEGPQGRAKSPEANETATTAGLDGEVTSPVQTSKQQQGSIRREIEVGPERFQAATGGLLERLADAIHRTITSVEEVRQRSELWDSLVIVGNGSKVKGFKEALLATIQSKYIISPSSATIFTSELPSNISTPIGTGANTPQPQQSQVYAPPGVNPLLVAATTAQNPHLHPSTPAHSHAHIQSSVQAHIQTPTPFPAQALAASQSQASSVPPQNAHSSHGQTPTSAKLAKIPDYFPEWKEAGYEDAVFLGAQVAAKVMFVVDQGVNKGYMARTDFNEQGPMGIHDYSM